MHVSMFSAGSDRLGVYAAFQRDYKRDVRQYRLFGTIGSVLLVVAAVQGPSSGWPWLVFGIGALVQAIVLFIDISNRHHLMHMIDWLDATESERRLIG